MADKIPECRVLSSDEYPEWERLIRESPSGSIYNSVEYLSILCAATDNRFKVCGIFEDGRLEGGIALHEMKYGSLWGVGNRTLLYYNGLVLRGTSFVPGSSEVVRKLSRCADWLNHQKYPWYELHCRTPSPGGIIDFRPFSSQGCVVTPTYSYVVTLEGAWERMDKNFRRLVRRAEDAGLTVTEDDDFESFFTLHRDIHDRKDAPIYLPKERFREFVLALQRQGLGKLITARLSDGTAVASQLVLTGSFKGSHTVCAGAFREHMALGTTPFLRWKAFESLKASGYLWNDLTDASLNSVTRFKSQLGGDLQMNFNIYHSGIKSLGILERAKNQVRRLLGRAR